MTGFCVEALYSNMCCNLRITVNIKKSKCKINQSFVICLYIVQVDSELKRIDAVTQMFVKFCVADVEVVCQ